METQLDAIVNLSNLTPNTTREQIKDYMVELGAKVGFVDYNRGKPEAWVRLLEGSKASEFVKTAAASQKKIDDSTPVVAALTGEPEQQYWQKIFEVKKASHKKQASKAPKGNKRGKKPSQKAEKAGKNKRKTEGDDAADAADSADGDEAVKSKKFKPSAE